MTRMLVLAMGLWLVLVGLALFVAAGRLFVHA